MFEVEKVNVAPGEHGVLLPAFPLLYRADGQAQLGGPDQGLYRVIFLTGPPLNLLSVGRQLTNVKKAVRAPDWPPPRY